MHLLLQGDVRGKWESTITVGEDGLVYKVAGTKLEQTQLHRQFHTSNMKFLVSRSLAKIT